MSIISTAHAHYHIPKNDAEAALARGRAANHLRFSDLDDVRFPVASQVTTARQLCKQDIAAAFQVDEHRREPYLVAKLTRRVGETLMVGDDVAVTVLGVKGNQVRIGIAAPSHINVVREELLERGRGKTAKSEGMES